MSGRRPVVFLGPSLPLGQAQAMLEADYRPPAAQGDVYRAVRDGARVVALVDGYFQSRPAVWHKEILWALARGAHVFGAASMGALRAAELSSFGMVGVGEVFDGFLTGRLVRDDEVAVLHGPAELGYPPCSEALVDMRATLAAAERADVFESSTGAALVTLAARQFYAERSYDRLLQAARDEGLCGDQLDSFAAWLPAGRVERKAEDARQLLERLLGQKEALREPFVPGFLFEETRFWREMTRLCDDPLLRMWTGGAKQR